MPFLVAQLLFVLGVGAVRDSATSHARRDGEGVFEVARQGNLIVSRLDQDANASTGICEADKVKAADSFCFSIMFPVCGVVKVEQALKVEFKHDLMNCFSFSVTGSVGVSVLGFRVGFSVQYALAQKGKTKTSRCSNVAPTPKIILSYLTNRVLQEAKGDTASDLADAGKNIMERYDSKKDAWNDGTDVPPIDAALVAESFTYIYGETKKKYAELRKGKKPNSIPAVVNMALEAFRLAYQVNDGPDVENCFDLDAPKADTSKWLWCYVLNIYPFTKESFHKLINHRDRVCFGGDEHQEIWDNLQDTSLGINIEVNADVCDGDEDDCVVTIPRAFMMLFNCYTWNIAKYMALSDTGDDVLDGAASHYDKAEAIEYILGTTDRQFGLGENVWNTLDLPDQDQTQAVGGAINDLAKEIVEDEIYWFKDEYEKYMWTYADKFKKMVEPNSDGRGDGYASAVPQVEKNYVLKEKLQIAASVGNAKNFCSKASLELALLHTLSFRPWGNVQTCVTGKASTKLVKTDSHDLILAVAPSLCYDYKKGSIITSFPLTLTHKKKGCAGLAFSAIRGNLKQRICTDPEYRTIRRIREALLALVSAGSRAQIATTEVGDEPDPVTMKRRFPAIVQAVTDAVRVAVMIVSAVFFSGSEEEKGKKAEEAADKVTGTGELADAAEPSWAIEAGCAKVVSQTLDIAAIPSKGAEALQPPQVGFATKVSLTFGETLTVKASQKYMAAFTDPQAAEEEEEDAF